MTSLAELAGTWQIDADHSRVGFAARHAMVTTVRGAFTDVAGALVLDPRGLEHSRVEVVVQAESLDTRHEDRDDHLRSRDFFDVEAHPTIEFRSRSIAERGPWRFMVVGDLSMHGVTREVILPLELVGVEVDPFGLTRAGLEGSRRIDRRRWGLEWNVPLDSGGLLISERVTLEFELSLIRTAG
ncbi:YceI family protein [Micrococcus sp.]|uniref:YceI family protein n=1 Tax=Micrococcus sp. TaxID=1271 RepID=UPI002A90F93B|nr:YceI family protein [Micrococcus sp.]MDY6055862.1 YceI family protein [Micrococcus sp.]